MAVNTVDNGKRTEGAPIFMVRSHTDTKHDIRIDICSRGNRLLRKPAVEELEMRLNPTPEVER